MTMETRDYLLGQISKLTGEVKSIMDEAEAAGADLTDTQQDGIKGRFERIEDLKVEVKRIEDREEMQKHLAALGTISDVATTDDQATEPDTFAQGFAESKRYQTFVSEYARTNSIPQHGWGDLFEIKAPGDPILESGLAGDPLAPQFDGTLRTPGNVQFPLRVADLLNIVQLGTGGNTVTYPVVETRTGPVGNPTAEGASKKGVVFDFNVESATLVKNTAFSGVSDEFFADAPRLVNWVQEQMGVMVLQDEETQIVNTLQAAITTSVTGIEIGGDSIAFDAIRAAMASIKIAGGVPDAILIHPNDAAAMDVKKATGGSEEYYSGAPYIGPRDSVWGGLRLVETLSVPTGSPIVGAFRAGASLYRKGGLRVESSNSHGDYFLEDKIALRAYLRSVAAVHYPEWFVTAETEISS